MPNLPTFAAALAAISTSAFAQIGTPYCAAAPNSTGQTALLSATGSTDVALGSVVLVCSRLPLQSLGYYLVSRTQGFTANPAGSSGNLCLGGAIGRYANQVLGAGSAGQVGLALDLTRLPSPSGPFAVQPGETLSFQYWHRDGGPSGPTSNFSQGLAIAFTGAAVIRLPDADGEGFESGALHDIPLGGAQWGADVAGERLLAPSRSGGSGRLGALRIRSGEVVTLDTDHQEFPLVRAGVRDPLDVLGNPAAGVYPSTLTVNDGVFEFAALVIESGGVLVLRGSNPARLVVRGQLEVADGAVIDASGQSVGFHRSDGARGQAGGAGGPGGGRGGDGADRADFTGTGLVTVGGLSNPGAERGGRAGTGVGGGPFGAGQGGEPWPPVYPTSLLSSIQGNNGDVAWNVAFHPNGALLDSCVSLQMGGPGGGGSYARVGTAGTAVPAPSAATVQFPTTGGSNVISGAGGAAGDLAGLGLEPPVPLSGHDIRRLRWERGHLRGGAGGGGGSNHPYMTLNGGDPPTAGNNCWFFLFGSPASILEWHDHSGGAGGGGGGAVELLAGRSITLDGRIEARGGQGGSSLSNPSPLAFDQYAMAGGGGAGGAVRVRAPDVVLSPNVIHFDVRGGAGGTAFWAFPTASSTASRGGDGSQGLVRIENSATSSTPLSGVPFTVAPFAAGSSQAGHPHLSVGVGGFDAVGSERPDAVTGAASCWIQPTGGVTRLRFRPDVGAALGQQGWTMNVVVQSTGGPNKRPFRGRTQQFSASFEDLYGNLVGYDLGAGEAASPIVVRFQGARVSGTLTTPCGVDPLDPLSPLEAGSLTPWVAHPSELNDLLDPMGAPYAPNVVRFVVLFDQTIDLLGGDTPGLTLQSEAVLGVDDVLILADEY